MELLLKLFTDAVFAMMFGVPLGFIVVELIHITVAKWKEKFDA